MFRRPLIAALSCAAPLLAAENRVAPPADVSGRTFVFSAAETETLKPEAIVGEATPTVRPSSFAGMELRIGPNNGKRNKARRGEPEYRVTGNVGQISFFDATKGTACIILYFETPESGSAVLSYELPGATRRHSGIRFTVKYKVVPFGFCKPDSVRPCGLCSHFSYGVAAVPRVYSGVQLIPGGL